jgi:hypothetical protein
MYVSSSGIGRGMGSGLVSCGYQVCYLGTSPLELKFNQ